MDLLNFVPPPPHTHTHLLRFFQPQVGAGRSGFSRFVKSCTWSEWLAKRFSQNLCHNVSWIAENVQENFQNVRRNIGKMLKERRILF